MGFSVFLQEEDYGRRGKQENSPFSPSCLPFNTAESEQCLWLLMTLNPSTLAVFASLCDENNVAPVCHWPLWRHERFGQHHLFLSCTDPPLHIVPLCWTCWFSAAPLKSCQKEMAPIFSQVTRVWLFFFTLGLIGDFLFVSLQIRDLLG